MKYLYFLIISLLIISCSGTKQIVETKEKETIPIQKTEKQNSMETTKDTLVEASIDIKPKITTIDTISKPIAKKDTVTVVTKPIIFNHDTWNSLLQKHVTNQGNVNYKGFKTNWKTLRAYITSLSENMPNDSWNKNEKLAYWINAYNAMTIDLILRQYPIKSIKDIEKPWDQRLWKLGNKWYNLNEIEHQILRKMDEPRIHFAIVCASFSCPKLHNQAFVASNIESQLTTATKDFLVDSKRNFISENELKLSKIFQWFAKDFKQDGSLIDFLNKYSDVKVASKAKKTFKTYNWDLNE